MNKQIEEMADDLSECITYAADESGEIDEWSTAFYLAKKNYRKVIMCKDCEYCEEHHYEKEGEKPYIKLTCKWSKYAHAPNDFCSMAKMKGTE